MKKLFEKIKNISFFKRLRKDDTFRWFMVIMVICFIIILLILWAGGQSFSKNQSAQEIRLQEKILQQKVKELQNKIQELQNNPSSSQTSSPIQIEGIQYETSE